MKQDEYTRYGMMRQLYLGGELRKKSEKFFLSKALIGVLKLDIIFDNFIVI